jgi:predicted ribosome quality control (RQC) complex YloA/Tae2 family protein
MNYYIETIQIHDIDYQLYIGKNAKGNDEIIKMAHPESLWFHFDQISSPHIVLESRGDNIPKQWIYKVALKLFHYKKNAPKCQCVIYTTIKNVKLTSVPGSVITQKTKVIKTG